MRLRSKPRPRRQHRTKLSVQTFYESEDERHLSLFTWSESHVILRKRDSHSKLSLVISDKTTWLKSQVAS